MKNETEENKNSLKPTAKQLFRQKFKFTIFLVGGFISLGMILLFYFKVASIPSQILPSTLPAPDFEEEYITVEKNSHCAQDQDCILVYMGEKKCPTSCDFSDPDYKCVSRDYYYEILRPEIERDIIEQYYGRRPQMNCCGRSDSVCSPFCDPFDPIVKQNEFEALCSEYCNKWLIEKQRLKCTCKDSECFTEVDTSNWKIYKTSAPYTNEGFTIKYPSGWVVLEDYSFGEGLYYLEKVILDPKSIGSEEGDSNLGVYKPFGLIEIRSMGRNFRDWLNNRRTGRRYLENESEVYVGRNRDIQSFYAEAPVCAPSMDLIFCYPGYEGLFYKVDMPGRYLVITANFFDQKEKQAYQRIFKQMLLTLELLEP